MRIAKFVSTISMCAALLFWLVGIASPRAEAQLASGTVTGSVVDPQAAAVPGATVRLISETRGTHVPEVTAGADGQFVVPDVPPDTYTLQISSKGFETFQRTALQVGPGDRVALGPLALVVGAISQTVTVSSETPLLQTESAERSATVTSTEVQNLPLLNRDFTGLTAVVPGVSTSTSPVRIGDRSSTGGNDTNIMVDGISAMDTGENAQSVAVNTESVAEMKVLVSDYQAEYGRSSGVQLTAVTKSGTNQFHGTGFLVMRQSGWYANSLTNKLNGNPRPYDKEKDTGFSIGGPIGKLGHNNKLFFFFSDEFDPRSNSGSITNYRVPTALEREGNFSQTTDNNGVLFPYIRDYQTNEACTNTATSASPQGCFDSGGVLGVIPSDRIYLATSGGLSPILNLYPSPTPGLATGPFNFQIASPKQSLMSQLPVGKIDYQPTSKLRGSFKLGLWGQPTNNILGTLPGFNDSREYRKWYYLWASTIDYSFNPTTYLEASFGASRNDLAGCVQGGTASAPDFCTSAIPTDKIASLAGAGLTGLPTLFPNAGVVDKSYYAYQVLSGINPAIWNGTAISMVPSFSWGGKVADAPPNFPFPGFLNTNQTHDVSISITKIRGNHTLKAGFYWTHSYKAQQRQGWLPSISFANDTNNPLDSQFGFANAALGIFDTYSQNSKYVEGNYIYNNDEAFIEDNWKVTPKLTLDYGMRFTHEQPQYDRLGQGVNFVPNLWNPANAPVLYTAACSVPQSPPGTSCPNSDRVAFNPVTNQPLGQGSVVDIGTLVPSSGNTLNGLFAPGTPPVPKTSFNWPAVVPAPRFGAAYSLNRRVVLRGGFGLFFDRTTGNSVFNEIQDPPNVLSETLYYSQLNTLGTGLTVSAAPNLAPYQLNSGLPSTWNWSGGAQIMLGQELIDVSYNGETSYNLVESDNINAIDFGTAFLPQYQDPTLVNNSPILGNDAVTANQMRSFRGYGTITDGVARGWYTSHSIQAGVTRRFSHGLSFGLNDTILLQQLGSTTPRYQHNADGTFAVRSDQGQADKLLADYIPTRHTLKGDFVYAIPTPSFKNASTAMNALKQVTKDWQLSTIWAANSPTAYTAGYSFQDGTGNQEITGSPDYGGRVRIVGNPGGGCSHNVLQQLNTSAFLPPLQGSVGLESGQDYLRSCFYQEFDTSLQRSIRFGETRQLEFRVDAFNLFNQAHITGRNATATFGSLSNLAIANLPANCGTSSEARCLPKNAGFGVANTYQGPRTLQLWMRFTF